MTDRGRSTASCPIMTVAAFGWALLALLGGACDLPERSLGTRGISLAGSSGTAVDAAGYGGIAAGGAGGDATAAPSCGRGFVVASSDYQSVNVSLLGLDGEVLSTSLISSGSKKPGLSAALSGDVVLPTERAAGDRIVLIDRYPTAVLTWVDLRTAAVPAQLSVATGFASNPHDYVELSAHKAYVPRFEPNYASGNEPFDAGNDVLVIDPSVPKITGRIDLLVAMAGVNRAYLPRADRALLAGTRLVVVLGGYTADFLDTVASRIVVIDTGTDTIVQTFVLEGFHGCSGLAASPERDELAVACSGNWGGTNVSDLASSGIARVSLGSELEEIARYPAAQFGEGAVGSSISYAGRTTLLFTTYGRFATGDVEAADDTLVELELETDGHEVLLRSADQPFTLGDVRCDSACQVCYVTDAAQNGGVVHRFEVVGGRVRHHGTIEIADSVGLPPRHLGQF
ncbi:MAG: hypothetical protein JW940_26845 [Polyangiaceae bacterium]|nr:hypothetical protein [Polyangiaceae bacterium]